MFLPYPLRKTVQSPIPPGRHRRIAHFAGGVTSGNLPPPALFRLLRVLLIPTSLPSLLAGCAATHAAISKRNLEVSTRMSDAVFLDPVGGDKRTAFIYVRNTPRPPQFRRRDAARIRRRRARVPDRDRSGRGPLQAPSTGPERLQDEHYRG